MEIRLSLASLALLAGIAWSLAPTTPVPTLRVESGTSRDLLELEDSFARGHDNLELTRRLSAEYLRLDQPGLAIGVVRRAAPALVADPILTHRLAQAYEAVGRVDDALMTARVARERCSRAVGSAEAGLSLAASRFNCTPAALVALEQHEQALAQMVLWGVSDPAHDPRARIAHGLSERRARIASLRE